MSKFLKSKFEDMVNEWDFGSMVEDWKTGVNCVDENGKYIRIRTGEAFGNLFSRLKILEDAVRNIQEIAEKK